GEVASSAYLVELANTNASAANIKAYAEIVRDKAVLRQLIEVGTGMVNDGFQPEGRQSTDLLAKAEQAVFAIAEAGTRRSCEFDEMTAGLQPTDLLILAARPAMGKTTLALNIAEYAALKTKKAVAVFSMEMSASQLALRLISAHGRVHAGRLRTGQLEDEDWS